MVRVYCGAVKVAVMLMLPLIGTAHGVVVPVHVPPVTVQPVKVLPPVALAVTGALAFFA
jgi:hypothetical protein